MLNSINKGTAIIAKNKNYDLIVFIILAFINIFFQIFPISSLALVVIIYTIIKCSYKEVIFLLLTTIPPMVGALLNFHEIGGVGGLLYIVGLILFIICVTLKQIKIINAGSVVIPMIIILFVLTSSVIFSSGGNYSNTKLFNTYFQAITSLCAYVLLFSNLEKFNTVKLCLIYILYATLYIQFNFLISSNYIPHSILQFGFMRDLASELFLNPDSGTFYISYHTPGFIALQGLGIFMLKYSQRLNKIFIFCFIITFLLTLYSGARQFIVIDIIFALIWVFFSLKAHSLFTKSFVFLLIIGIISYVISLLISDEGMFASIFQQGYMDASNRGINTIAAIDQFSKNILTGVGYGRYVVLGSYGSYAHNLVLELLSELGILGFIVIIGTTIFCLIRNVKNVLVWIYLVLIFFLRSMVSGGLDSNIVLFSVLFSLPVLQQKLKELQKIKLN